jgi:predicted exporter
VSADVEARLRETLFSRAADVEQSPAACRRAQAAWRRRQRRRRVLLVALATIAIGGADTVWLWVFDPGPEHPPVVFDGSEPASAP